MALLISRYRSDLNSIQEQFEQLIATEDKLAIREFLDDQKLQM